MTLGEQFPIVLHLHELVDAVKKFVAQVRANKSLFDGIVASTKAGLAELSGVIKDF